MRRAEVFASDNLEWNVRQRFKARQLFEVGRIWGSMCDHVGPG